MRNHHERRRYLFSFCHHKQSECHCLPHKQRDQSVGPGSPLVSLSGGDTERRQLQRAPRRAAWIFTLDDRKKRTKPGGTEVYRLSASLKSTNSKVKGNCYSFIGGINCGPREGLLPATPPPTANHNDHVPPLPTQSSAGSGRNYRVFSIYGFTRFVHLYIINVLRLALRNVYVKRL